MKNSLTLTLVLIGNFACVGAQEAVKITQAKTGRSLMVEVIGMKGRNLTFKTQQGKQFELEVSQLTPDSMDRVKAALNLPQGEGSVTTTVSSSQENSIEGKKKAGETRTIGGMMFSWIPAGDFTMGNADYEGSNRSRKTQVKLTKGFWIGKYEVTQGRYEEMLGTNPSGFKPTGEKAPVENVNWQDAMDFCKKLTERERVKGNLLPEGWIFTLPTEAQWEYACRAGEKGPYSGGDLDEVGWFKDNAGHKTHEVGQKKPNAWGLYDMHGNIWEWCADWHVVKLPGGTDPKGPATGTARVLRGGSWLDPGIYCRSLYRYWSFPTSSRLGNIGFRVAIVPSGTGQ